MRRLFLIPGLILVAAALTLSVIVGSSRPFTVYGTGTQGLAKPLSQAAALNRNLVSQLKALPGATAAPTTAVGYNQGDRLHGLALCRSEDEGVYSFNTAVRYPASASPLTTANRIDAAIKAFGEQTHGQVKVQVSSPKNPLASRVIRFSGATKGSILTTFDNHMLYLSGSVDGCYPLSQLPATTANALEHK